MLVQILGSALKTKSELMRCVQSILEQNVSEAPAPMHAAHRNTERLARRLPSGSATRSLTPADHIRSASTIFRVMYEAIHKVSSDLYTLCRLNRKFDISRVQAASKAMDSLVSERETGNFYRGPSQRIPQGDSIYQHGSGSVELKGCDEFDEALLQQAQKRPGSADRTAPQSIARRTIQAQVQGMGGGLWKREDTRIQFAPWHDKGMLGGGDDGEERGVKPKAPALELEDLFDESGRRITPRQMHEAAPHSRESGDEGGQAGDGTRARSDLLVDFGGVSDREKHILNSNRRRKCLGATFRIW